MLKELVKYTHYNRWANDLLFSLIEEEINDEMLDRKIESSFPSLRKTVYHIWDAEFIWLKRLKGESLKDGQSKNFKGNFSDAKKIILENASEFIALVEHLDEEKLLSVYEYKNIEGKSFSNPVWESVLHCMNHSTYHRGQIITMLRQLGITTVPSTDFTTYCRSNLYSAK